LVVLSPIALASLKSLNRDWSQLSNIGQTYGAISALISSLALGGVVVSLIYQARELRTSRNQTVRDFHHRLMRMEMEDPTLMTAMGAPWNLPIPAESDKIREYLYLNMWVSYWAGNYVLGEMTDLEVARTARNELFRSNAGRAYWTAIRINVLAEPKNKYRRFSRIIDSEYEKALSENTPVNDPVKVTSQADNSEPLGEKRFRHSLPIGAALIFGILAGRKLNRRSIG
jgi:hypothetical protein